MAWPDSFHKATELWLADNWTPDSPRDMGLTTLADYISTFGVGCTHDRVSGWLAGAVPWERYEPVLCKAFGHYGLGPGEMQAARERNRQLHRSQTKAGWYLKVMEITKNESMATHVMDRCGEDLDGIRKWVDRNGKCERATQ